MRRLAPACLGFLLLAGGHEVCAIDINPSKTTVPRNAWDTGGNRFSIFNGDPKRIQRANQVDAAAFDLKLTVSPEPYSLRAARAAGPNPSLKVTFSVHNHSRKTYVLSFPSAQRWDFRISNAAGAVLYTYSEACDFLPTIGSSMVNQDDKLSYSESVPLDDLALPLTPGVYVVHAVMANYPEMSAQAQFTVQD